MTPLSGHDLDDLLSNAAWARALARTLTRDAQRADDLVQRAFVAALEHPPRDRGSPRGWIAQVLRNFARQDARAESRRAHHERAGARPESVDPRGVDERAAAQRELLDAVMSLYEPYRSTIWARYYDGLAPREIARRDGIALKTVKARLVRGLADLRQRLDTNHGGDRTAWMAALAPLAAAHHVTAASVGALMIDVKLKVAAALVVAVGTVAVLVRVTGTTPVRPEPLSSASLVAPELERGPAMTKLASDAPDSTRAALEPPKVAVPPVIATPAVHEWSGRVLDLDLRPKRDFEVFARANPHDPGTGQPALTTTGTDGSFRIPARDGRIELGARAAGWGTVFAASNAWVQSDDGYTIFVAPQRALAGRILDPQRRPIEGASVSFICDASLRRDLGKQVDTSMPTEWHAVSDVDGHFALESAPLTRGQLAVEAVNHQARNVDAPTQPVWDMEIVLDPLEQEHLIVHGTVVDEHARPLAGATVALGPQSLKTTDDGAFAFDMDDVHDGGESLKSSEGVWVSRFKSDALFAVKPGKLPARVELPAIAEMRSHAAATTFTLVLSGEPLEIRGRVLDDEGKPLSHAMVCVQDETPFGMVYDKVQGEGIGLSTSVEALLRGDSAFTRTYADKDGAFTLGGMLDHEYHVLAVDLNTLKRSASEAVRPGAGSVVIRLPVCERCSRVAGHVLALDGTPIEGARVGLSSRIVDASTSTEGPNVSTKKDGSFEFPSVFTAGLTINVNHPDTFFLMGWKPDVDAAFDALDIRVSRKAHVQVDLGSDAAKADEFALVDPHDKPVEMMMSRGSMMWMPERVAIVDGKSEAVACSENGAAVVLYKAKAEVARLPVHLVPGEVTTVRP